MNEFDADIAIVGAGPVGLMCAYLAKICGLKALIFDRSDAPLSVGRADALNARTLQLLEIVDLFNELYLQGKPCNTSSVWENGRFISRQSQWWDELEGCFHKHFLMLGQSYIENSLDTKLKELNVGVQRHSGIEDIQINVEGCLIKLANGKQFKSRFLIGADGARSLVRTKLNIPFEITRPEIIWAVVDGVIESQFPKVPEIIVFQNETSDVAWIPRERDIDRFYVRMDVKEFTFDEVLAKINRAISPYSITFKHVEWFSQFAVKESVAENFSILNRAFLAGDACHIHSVNGGQGLNTGLGDAFNLVWKLNMVINHNVSDHILQTYEDERKPVALSVIESSGELVRSTKFSTAQTHAMDYVKIVAKRSGNITGMGIRYGTDGLKGQRLFDFNIQFQNKSTRIYSLLDYSKFTLILFSEVFEIPSLKPYVQVLWVSSASAEYYKDQALLVRPDGYIESHSSLDHIEGLLGKITDAS